MTENENITGGIMSEIEKMYENAEIEQRCKHKTYINAKNTRSYNGFFQTNKNAKKGFEVDFLRV